ncbi:hypothetical protein QQZ08_005507 [Neonectria magnoliae]|uniref:Uncharacterized protein n=1 Tax=Neonectria magnoliae TaxID=2732573 RepID=A0ABR1I4Y9_9HYPO
MAHQKLIPEFIAKVDAQGRPRWPLVIMDANALDLPQPERHVPWFATALTAQNDPLFTQAYAWKSVAWPIALAWLMAVSTLLFACCLGAGIGDLTTTPFNAKTFFQYVIGILIIVVFTGV